MANNKTGFNYYNVDTDRYQDIKIKRLKRSFGCAGIAVYDYILCEIYRVKGCFIEWDDCTAFDVADYFGIKESLVNEIVNYCGVVGLFNRELLTGGRIITSLSIQRRYLDMCSRAKRSNYGIPLNVKLEEESAKLQEQSDIIPEEKPQSKVKKSKGEKRKKKSPPLTPKGGNLKSYEEIFLEGIEPCWADEIRIWLKYKAGKNQKYKDIASLETCLKKLIENSGNSAAEARRIIESAIGNNYSGFFPLVKSYKHSAVNYHQSNNDYERRFTQN